MGLNDGLIYTNQNCIGCNRCISYCPVLGANVSVKIDGKNHIHVDNEKCLHCGNCLKVCHHNAREYRDDTEDFLAALSRKESISLLVAPSFFIIYEEKAYQILGYLKELGVHLIYDVSYGADIATWAYLSYLEQNPLEGAIAPPCSAIVNYIRKYSDTLYDQLIPVYSPLFCLAVYVKKYLKNTDKLAFLSPCIAKKDEIELFRLDNLVNYNVTYDHLFRAVCDIDISQYTTRTELEDFGLGRIFPMPGGLAENLKLFLPKNTLIREQCGEKTAYEYLHQLENRIHSGKRLPFVIDCLNCEHGCLSGTATVEHNVFNDDILFNLLNQKQTTPLIKEEENPYVRHMDPDVRRERLNQRFATLKLADFMADYPKNSEDEVMQKKISDAEYSKAINQIFISMYKFTPESRCIDCHSCGYNSCQQMAEAIYMGYNSIENCVHYLKDENYRISRYDTKLNMPNINAFLELIDRLIAEQRMQEYALIYFNIENFKSLNQRYGYAKGDVALKEYCTNISKLGKEGEIVAILGGTTFVGAFYREDLEDALQALSSVSIDSLYDVGTTRREIIHARIAVYRPDGLDRTAHSVMEKLMLTFTALNRQRSKRVLYYDDEMIMQFFNEEMVKNAIEPAIKNREFVVYYQPKVSISNKKLVGAEALVRWYKDGKIIPPGEFIPICEKTGLVVQLDFYVLDRVCQDIASWLSQGIEVVPVSVNFSKQHFEKSDIAERINAIIEKYHVPQKYFEIEFTETAYIDNNEKLVSSIDKLHEFGIASSMDDFGTGYSSLSMLRNMTFDTLKLDKTFLDGDSLEDVKSSIVLKSIISMAKTLNMSIVSEGIESEKELAFMKQLGCDIAQGYFFDKPLTHDDFEKRLIQQYYE